MRVEKKRSTRALLVYKHRLTAARMAPNMCEEEHTDHKSRGYHTASTRQGSAKVELDFSLQMMRVNYNEDIPESIQNPEGQK